MNLTEIREQLEEDATWRLNEVRLLKNQLAFIPSHKDKQIVRKSLVVMLYAHLEGFFKYAFTVYVDAINSENLTRGKVNDHIRAACLADYFDALESAKKNKVLSAPLPPESELHRFSRQVAFLQNHAKIMRQRVKLSPNSIVATGSNLHPIVVQTILYRLGLPHDKFKPHHGVIQRLVNTRNEIAHGKRRSGIKDADFAILYSGTNAVMTGVIREIYHALRTRAYLR